MLSYLILVSKANGLVLDRRLRRQAPIGSIRAIPSREVLKLVGSDSSKRELSISKWLDSGFSESSYKLALSMSSCLSQSKLSLSCYICSATSSVFLPTNFLLAHTVY
jgi:hypothetical protein